MHGGKVSRVVKILLFRAEEFHSIILASHSCTTYQWGTFTGGWVGAESKQ